MCATVSLPCRLYTRNLHATLFVQAVCFKFTQPYTLHARCVHKKDERNNFLTASLRAGCVLEIDTRKICVTIPLPCARSLCKKDVRDSFLTVQAVCSQLEMCMTASLPCRLCARGLRRNDVRDSFQTVQAMCSKFAQERREGQFPYRAVCVLEITQERYGSKILYCAPSLHN